MFQMVSMEFLTSGPATDSFPSFNDENLVSCKVFSYCCSQAIYARTHHKNTLHVPPEQARNHQIVVKYSIETWQVMLPPPHDRGSKLWDAASGPSRLLISSIDRWTTAMLSDDGIEMPFMGGAQEIEARIIARSREHSSRMRGC